MPLDLKAFENRVWLMEEGHFHASLSRLSMFTDCYSSREVAKERRKRLDEARAVTSSGAMRPMQAGGLVAVIPVLGALDNRMTSALMKANGTSTQDISEMLDACAADPRVSSIVLDVDSGGGSASGLSEISDKVYAMRGEKKTYAISNCFCASAAYWLASSAEFMICSPSAEVGSVGAYVVVAEESEALKMEGVKVTLIKATASPFKAEVMPFLPLSDEARQHIQEEVDAVFVKFVQAVARNRGTSVADVKANFGQGRMVNADKALAAGMVDKICSMDDLLNSLASGKSVGGTQRKRASAEEVADARARISQLRASAT